MIYRCVDCKRPCHKSICDSCKAERRRLFAMHRSWDECEADQESRSLRVELYAAVVAHNGKLFEKQGAK